MPEFADDEEEELYDFLNLELQSDLKDDLMRHYEVVYLIHEKHAEEVDAVNEKVQDFLREKKGKIWRMNDWGMRSSFALDFSLSTLALAIICISIPSRGAQSEPLDG
ncbi:unnamed protein product [Linum tenue]|uniref:Uncharacterized protein n=1 Tax=Linum tenue TaxID=586396 RepID=A0AAV0IV82_9ROSI|nr:unnamed protein product [Linum tenue]